MPSQVDTIFALSSGPPPAALAVVRISGANAHRAAKAMAGNLPSERSAKVRTLRAPDGIILDQAIVIVFSGPRSSTGEDLVEFHLHGGRAVVAAVENCLGAQAGLRKAEPGEFTRRAFANGRIDLAQAEGLADLLEAETELQRRAALSMASGALSHEAARWRLSVLQLAAGVEMALDFADEDDSGDVPEHLGQLAAELAGEIGSWLERPRAEALRSGYRVVLAGPPNAGKSTLFNAFVGEYAAITSPYAGTTRDGIERPVALSGIPFTFIDTAGLRSDGIDPIEQIGIAIAIELQKTADCVLWLGREGHGPEGCWEIDAQCDNSSRTAKTMPRHRISAITGEGMAELRDDLIMTAQSTLPRPGSAAINARQAALLSEAECALKAIGELANPLIVAEQLRLARSSFDKLMGHASPEHMLDTLFGRFCIGK